MLFFSSSDDLKAYVKENNEYTRCGDWSIGTLEFIDTRDLHVVFSNRQDYEQWCAAGCPQQMLLF